MARLLTLLAEAFYRQPSELTFLAYEIALADISLEFLEEACFRALRECTFMPSVHEIRVLAEEARFEHWREERRIREMRRPIVREQRAKPLNARKTAGGISFD